MGPWLDQLARYGQAGELAVDMLQAQDGGGRGGAWRASLALEPLREAAARSPVTVGKGVLGPFLDRAVKEADGLDGRGPSARPAAAEAHGRRPDGTDAYTVGGGRPARRR